MKSVFFTKSGISLVATKYACFNLVVKYPANNLLNSGVAIYLLWLAILFSTAVTAVVARKLVISGILSSISLILVLYTSFLTT